MNILHNDDGTHGRTRGQVGIGTLIVFIAMVLVAAIAAGVLINTAGVLQTQAEDTGTESTEQVANNINVITEVGEVSANDNVNELRVGVQPTSGADDINLAELTLQYVSDDDFGNLIVGNDTEDPGADTATGDTDPADISVGADYNNDGVHDEARNAEDERYDVEVITAEQEEDIVMTDGSDRYELVVPLHDDAIDQDIGEDNFNGDLGPLGEGEEVEMRITTQVGAQVISFMQVPDSLSGEDTGSNVNL